MHLYAEHLLNLRQVTVFVTLPSPSNDETRVQLSTAVPVITITHNKSSTDLNLPCAVSQGLGPSIPEIGTKDLSFRFKALPSDSSSLSKSTNHHLWSAPELAAGVQVGCAKCKQSLTECMSEWKDLPSGGWADMMDFWHCNKPDVPNGVAHTAGNAKGYAADTLLGPTSGCGLVDVSSFLFARGDCTGVEVSGSFRLLFLPSKYALPSNTSGQ